LLRVAFLGVQAREKEERQKKKKIAAYIGCLWLLGHGEIQNKGVVRREARFALNA